MQCRFRKLQYGCEKERHSPLPPPTRQTVLSACSGPGSMRCTEDVELSNARSSGRLRKDSEQKRSVSKYLQYGSGLQ